MWEPIPISSPLALKDRNYPFQYICCPLAPALRCFGIFGKGCGCPNLQARSNQRTQFASEDNPTAECARGSPGAIHPDLRDTSRLFLRLSKIKRRVVGLCFPPRGLCSEFDFGERALQPAGGCKPRRLCGKTQPDPQKQERAEDFRKARIHRNKIECFVTFAQSNVGCLTNFLRPKTPAEV
jgi:hypothetical protein